jgi:hypothetical protein
MTVIARRESSAWARQRRLPAWPEGSRGCRRRAFLERGNGTPDSARAASSQRITGITEIGGEKQLKSTNPAPHWFRKEIFCRG